MALEKNIQGISLAKLVDVLLPTGVASLQVTGLQLDQRKINAGDVFLAIPGGVHDGRNFIDQAIAQGAVAIIAEAENTGVTFKQVVPVIGVPQLQKHASTIASRFFGDPSSELCVFGVTGTNGKSTVTYLIAQLLDELDQSSAVMGTLGYGLVHTGKASLQETGLTTADPVSVQKHLSELKTKQVDAVAMEVSSHALVQSRVAAVKFDVAVFTNLSRDHLDLHGDMESYGKAKAALFAFDSVTASVINIDDPFGRNLLSTIKNKAWSYSVSDRGADVYAENTQFNVDGFVATLHSPWGTAEIRSGLIGVFNLSNVVAAVTAVCAKGYSFKRVVNAVENLHAVPGRMEKVSEDNQPLTIIDYAHTPDGLEKALLALRPQTMGKLVVVFGCGGDRDKGKRPVMANIAENLADRVIATSDNPRTESQTLIFEDMKQGFENPKSVEFIESRSEAIQAAIAEALIGDAVLIAGKGHEDYQLIGDKKFNFSDANYARNALRCWQVAQESKS